MEKERGYSRLIKCLGGEEFLKIDPGLSPDLKAIEDCGEYLGILLLGDDIGKVNEKAEWIKRESTLLVAWESLSCSKIPEDLSLGLIDFIILSDGTVYEVRMSREIDPISEDPIYGVEEL